MTAVLKVSFALEAILEVVVGGSGDEVLEPLDLGVSCTVGMFTFCY